VPATIESCGQTTATGADGGVTDGGTSDAGGVADAGVADAGIVDTGARDGARDGASGDGATGAVDILDPRFVCSSSQSGAGSISVGGLQDDVEYRFYAVAIDDARNPSEPVELGTATPAKEEDLWERYKRSGGQAGGGCQLGGVTPIGIVAPLLLLGLVALHHRHRRHRRARPRARASKRLPLLGALLLLGTAPRPASAQAVDAGDFTSPQRFAFEIKLGPYAPDIDSEFAGGPTPFGDLFGDGDSVMIGGELDVQLWQGFGSIGVGVSIGYYGNSANALLDDGNTPSQSTERSAGETSITLVPMSALLVYRFDVLARRWAVPLVPFVKFGVNYTLWWIHDGAGDVATYEGEEAKGGSAGIQFNVGAALLLDIFEPAAAKALDNDIGINHTYLIFELLHQPADGFGADDKLTVGDTTWQAGLAFEF